MTTSTYFVLASLLDARLHGYAIVQSVERMSGGEVRLTTGTLYGALDRLQRQGLIALDGEEVVESRLRRYYRLTDEGVDAVREETERMRRAVTEVAPRLVTRGTSA